MYTKSLKSECEYLNHLIKCECEYTTHPITESEKEFYRACAFSESEINSLNERASENIFSVPVRVQRARVHKLLFE